MPVESLICRYIYLNAFLQNRILSAVCTRLCSKGVSPGGATSSVSAEETKKLLLDYQFALPPLCHQLDYTVIPNLIVLVDHRFRVIQHPPLPDFLNNHSKVFILMSK